MDLRARLQLMPPGSLVAAAWILEELEREASSSGESRSGAGADLTVVEVAERLGRRPGTVRDWVRGQRLRAYLFNQREYRITEAALAEFLETQRNGTSAPERPARSGRADLSSWRKLRNAS
jgi:excisionase family DNA binding protein